MAAPFMLVRDLIAHLSTLDQELPVVAFNAHEDDGLVSVETIFETDNAASSFVLKGGGRVRGPFLKIAGAL